MNLISTAEVDASRLAANASLDPVRKAALGQFMTPSPLADFMAGMFRQHPAPHARLLDCGAGVGSLAVAAALRLPEINHIEAWEIEPSLLPYLERNLSRVPVPSTVHQSDFIYDSVINIATARGSRFTHAILNPPYKKIGSGSRSRLLLRKVGVETVNLYVAFLALTILLTERGGEIVAIIPRSFCNGSYYKPFRQFLLRHCSIDRVHVFDSRTKAFKEDDVIQENVILKLGRGTPQGATIISTSEDHRLGNYRERRVGFAKIVKADDPEAFIHIPTRRTRSALGGLLASTISDIGLEVCTGPVVDFRLREFWLSEPTADSVPLLYPHHFVSGVLEYPRQHRKPNALKLAPDVSKWLMPNECYVIVKRFSAKEERRRVVAYVVEPGTLPGDQLGFENHWNVFHTARRGIDPLMAKGLACVLNCTAFDQQFRDFSGHTQVNATDLRNMRYPDVGTLKRLGRRFRVGMSQDEVDSLIASVQ